MHQTFDLYTKPSKNVARLLRSVLACKSAAASRRAMPLRRGLLLLSVTIARGQHRSDELADWLLG
eukprot:2199982-Prymnesium_polylepis.1